MIFQLLLLKIKKKNWKYQPTVINLEFSDIFLPSINCKGVTINMQQTAPMIALTPNFV